MRSESARIAVELIRAVSGRRVEDAVALTSPDVVIHIEGLETFERHEGLRDLMVFQDEVLHDLRVEILRVLGAGDTAAVERVEHFTVKGNAVVLPIGAFFTVEGGVVTRWEDIQDFRDVARALGH